MPHSNPALVLAELLDTLPPADRHEIFAMLMGRGSSYPATLTSHFPDLRPDLRRAVGGTLVSGEANQLVTIRMPNDLHTTLRDWCSEHNFTMAAVIRGLVERFLSEQLPNEPGLARHDPTAARGNVTETP